MLKGEPVEKLYSPAYRILPRVKEANTPAVQSIPKTVKAVFTALRRAKYKGGVISICPIKTAKVSMAIPMLKI